MPCLARNFRITSPYAPINHRLVPMPAVEFLWAAEADSSNADVKTENSDTADPSDSLPPIRFRSPRRSFLRTADEESARDQTPAERRRRREADWIARRIRSMLDSGEKIVCDQEASKAGKPAVRPVRPGDIALLFRALTDVEYYEDACAATASITILWADMPFTPSRKCSIC